MKKLRHLKSSTLLLALLLLAALLGGILPAGASDTPCTDQWASCTQSAEWCDGQWCGCMGARYGYQCAATFVGGGQVDHRAIEKEMQKSRNKK